MEVEKTQRWGPLIAMACALAAFSWAMGRHLDDIAALSMGRDFRLLYEGATDASPLLLAIVEPLTAIELKTALALWLLINQAFLGITVWGAANLWRSGTKDPPSELFSVTFALLVAFTAPVMDHNWQGQSHLLVMALSTWSLVFHVREKDVWCGACLAPALLIEPALALLLPFFVLRRRPLALVYSLVPCAVFALAVDHSAFATSFVESVLASDVTSTTGNLSIDAAARAKRLLPMDAAGLRIGIVAVVLWLTHREATGTPMQGALRLTQAFLLLSCVLAEWWAHHLVALIPAFYLVLHAVFVDRRRRRVGALALAAAIILATIHHPLFFWKLLAGPAHESLRNTLWELDRVALVLLFAAVELLIREGSGIAKAQE